jgi:hypothetical protein
MLSLKLIRRTGAFCLFAILGAVHAAELPATDPQGLWSTFDEASVAGRGERWIQPRAYRPMQLDFAAVQSMLATAPNEDAARSGAAGVHLTLPQPDGGFARFQVVESLVMEPELAAKYPSIRTYAGRGIDDPAAAVRIDVTPLGFHAQVLTPQGDFFLDPMYLADVEHYVSYFRKDHSRDAGQRRCETHGEDLSLPTEARSASTVGTLGTPNTVGPQLRQIRLAMAATSSYTNVFGGTVSAGMSGVTTLVNRLNGVYERDLGLRLVLVANNDLIVYTDSNVGPIGPAPTGPDPIIQTTIDNAIGFANYDLGHAVGGSGGGGAITPLGNVCTSAKAQGFTSFDTPRGDIFDIDFVAHELGHQLGANHTWNGCANQSAGQWTPASAMEPGSGTTIMAYAGICTDNLQPNSDANFHARSFTQIVARLALDETGTPPTCGSNVATGNNAPSVSAGAAMTIPEQTPFQLTASGSDGDGDTVTYNWEQTDTGTRGAPSSTGDNGTAPLFRSLNSSLSPTRIFPSLVYILDNNNVPPLTIPLPPAAGSYYTAEILPNPSAGTRVMNFRVTARDNHAIGGGVAFATAQVTATSAAGPFAVNNVTGPLTGGSSLAITWNVANTTAAPVSTSLVNILVSLDGGYTFSTLLAGTANDGSEMVTVPNIATARARFKVEAANGTGVGAGNTWFDITGTNVAINASGTPITLTPGGFISTQQGSPAPAPTAIATIAGGTAPYTLSAATFPEIPEITVQNLGEAGGTISASAFASCKLAAPNEPTYRIYPAVLRVTDSGNRQASTVFPIRVANNDIPSIGTYANQSVARGNNLNISPSAPPSDPNGNFAAVSVTPTSLPGGGTVSVNPSTGEVTVATTPTTTLGAHTIRVSAADTCGAAGVQQFTLTVTTVDPVLQYNGNALTTGNFVLEPNECNTMAVTLGNVGGSAATTVASTLSSPTSGVTITSANSSYPDIASNGSGVNNVLYEISTAPSLACGSMVDFTQNVTYAGVGSPAVFNFSLRVGQPPAPNYTIASASAAGTIAAGALVAGSQDDDIRVAVPAFPAGFAFSIYDTPVTSLFVDTNGVLLFNADGGTSTASNAALPVGAFAAPALVGFWDDLDMSASATTGGGVFTQVNGVAPNRTFDIEWRATRYRSGATPTAPTVRFMMRLHETTNLMEIYYTTVTGNGSPSGANGSSATVGIQQAAPAGSIFTQYSNNSASLSAGQRLTLTRAPGVCNPGPAVCVDPAERVFRDGFE